MWVADRTCQAQLPVRIEIHQPNEHGNEGTELSVERITRGSPKRIRKRIATREARAGEPYERAEQQAGTQRSNASHVVYRARSLVPARSLASAPAISCECGR